MEEVEQICGPHSHHGSWQAFGLGHRRRVEGDDRHRRTYQCVETDDLGGTHDESGTRKTLEELRALPCVVGADYDGHELTVRCCRGDHNLLDVLTLLKPTARISGIFPPGSRR